MDNLQRITLTVTGMIYAGCEHKIESKLKKAFALLRCVRIMSKVLVMESDQHQDFGYFSGTVILDDGQKLIVGKLLGFAEKVKNRW